MCGISLERFTKLRVFCGDEVEVMRNLRGGISLQSPEMYILSYKTCTFLGGSTVNVRLNLREGLSPEKQQMHILGNKLSPFSAAGVEVRQNLGGGISPQGEKCIFLVSKLHFFVDLE